MIDAERVLWMRAMARARGMAPDLSAAVLRAFQLIREAFTDAELADVIESGNLDRLFAEALDQAMMDRAFLPLRSRIRQATQRGFKYAVTDLPKGGTVDGVLSVMFDHLSPNVITAIRTLESRVITSLQSDVRETVRAVVENGLRDGLGPRTIARDLRSSIGLGPSQLKQVENFRAALEGRDGRVVTDYTLRDKRFTAPTTPEQVDKQVADYLKRRIAQNAETNARTLALDSMKLGNRLAWQSAIDAGIVDPNRLMKQWKGVMDSRERPEHVAMQNETTPFDMPYSNGQMVPGDDEYNCRCIDRIFLARTA